MLEEKGQVHSKADEKKKAFLVNQRKYLTIKHSFILLKAKSQTKNQSTNSRSKRAVKKISLKRGY